MSIEKQIATIEAAKGRVDQLKGELEEAQGEFRDGLRKLLDDHGKGPHVIGGKSSVISVRKSASSPVGTPVLMPDRIGAKGARKPKAAAAGDAASGGAPKKGGRKKASAQASASA